MWNLNDQFHHHYRSYDDFYQRMTRAIRHGKSQNWLFSNEMLLQVRRFAARPMIPMPEELTAHENET